MMEWKEQIVYPKTKREQAVQDAHWRTGNLITRRGKFYKVLETSLSPESEGNPVLTLFCQELTQAELLHLREQD